MTETPQRFEISVSNVLDLVVPNHPSILIQRENPALPVSDECSDAQSEPRSEQGGSESRKLWLEAAELLLVLSLQRFKTCF